MNTLLLAALTLPTLGLNPGSPMAAQTATAPTLAKKPVIFACDMKAMTPAQRKRQTAVLVPALKAAELHSNEVADGYTFEFPSDAKTFSTLSEWIGNERLCCPFFEFDVHVADSTSPMTLRITGPEGVKQFIRAELAGLVAL